MRVWIWMLVLVGGAAAAQDLTLVRAQRVITMDPARPFATAFAFDGSGKLVAVGEGDELAKVHPQAVTLDLGDATVVPGLIDAHGHVPGLGLTLSIADLTGTRSKAEIVERLKAFEARLAKDAWLLGRGWDQNDWDAKAFPTAADLDAAFPTRPVWLERVDGHAGWANSAALKRATRDLAGDWQPEGGQVLRAGGKASGVFVDNAMGLIQAAVPAPTAEQATQALSDAMADIARHGLTGVHDAGVSKAEMALYRGLADAGRMPVRIHAMANGDGEALEWLCAEGRYRHAGGRLQMRAVKLYADGALGSRGAALLAEYSDDPGNTGLLVTSAAALEAAARKAQRCGVQAATHAIGDRGNRVVLEVYERVLGLDAAASDHRWRIEHAQVVAQVDIPRFARSGIIASMQPTHATSDMPWAGQRVGPARIVGAYAWRQFRDAGVRLALGSDFPVEAVDPLPGLFAARMRQDAQGMPLDSWFPGERLTAFEALRGFTLDAAYAAFMENEVGSLVAGKRADFTVLDRNPLGDEAKDLLAAHVRATYLDGKPTYTAAP